MALREDEACSTCGSMLLETLDVRGSSTTESKEKTAVGQTKCESWQSHLSNKCRCST